MAGDIHAKRAPRAPSKVDRITLKVFGFLQGTAEGTIGISALVVLVLAVLYAAIHSF